MAESTGTATKPVPTIEEVDGMTQAEYGALTPDERRVVDLVQQRRDLRETLLVLRPLALAMQPLEHKDRIHWKDAPKSYKTRLTDAGRDLVEHCIPLAEEAMERCGEISGDEASEGWLVSSYAYAFLIAARSWPGEGEHGPIFALLEDHSVTWTYEHLCEKLARMEASLRELGGASDG